MNTHIWKKLWAFLNQTLFDQNSAKVEWLERCWDTYYIQDAEPDLKLLEHCWDMSFRQESSATVKRDLELLERCWDTYYIQDAEPDSELPEHCWDTSCFEPECDR